MDNEVKSLIKNSAHTWGIYAEDLNAARNYKFNENRVFETASTIKLFILLALFNKMVDKKITFKTPIKIGRKQIGTGSGILQYWNLEQPIAIYNIAHLMIVVSDNTATNVLIDFLGKNYINGYIQKELKLKRTKLISPKVNFPSGFKLKSTKMGTTTPYEISMTLKNLEERKLFDDKTTKQIIKIMSEQEYTGKIPRFLPTWDNLGARKKQISKIANKTGAIVYQNDNWFSTRSDAALIYTKSKKRIVIAIYYEGFDKKEHMFTPENEGNLILSKISEVIFKSFNK